VKLVSRGAIAASACLLVAGVATGCSSSTETASSTTPPSSDSTRSGTASPNNPDQPPCTADALSAGLNGDGTIEKFNCASGAGTYWAAAEIQETKDSEPMFWFARDGQWYERDTEKVCKGGGDLFNLPQVIREYCPSS
jgi:hypothetical protein